MSNVKRIKNNKIKESVPTGYSFAGGPTLRGGPYGFGHKKQLATVLNPATDSVEKQEQEELNTNIDDQSRLNRKYGSILDPLVERNVGDGQHAYLPGNYRENALEYSQIHLPPENLQIDASIAGPMNDGTEKYLVDDIIDELEERERELTESMGGVGGNYVFQIKPHLPPYQEQENLGHSTYLASPEHTSMSYGAVLSPKNFVPNEFIQQADIDDNDSNGLDDSIELKQKTPLKTNKIVEAFIDLEINRLLSRRKMLK